MNRKRKNILFGITTVMLLLLVVGATYAYFTLGGNSGTSTDVVVKSYTTDILTFEVGEPLTFEMDQESFASGKGNATGTTTAKITLIANNKTNSATRNYYLYLNILNNTFVYSQDNNTPELLLSITDGSGNEKTGIEGVTYKTLTDAKGIEVSGYDITTKKGAIKIFDNRSITASPNLVEEWNIKITFVNYDFDQSLNAGKIFSSKLLLQRDELPYHEGCDPDTISCVVAKNYDGTQGEGNVYYHDSNLTNGAKDKSYRYSGADPNNYVCFGSDEDVCPTDNLYRIIGVFDGKTKLIKANQATSTLLGTDGDFANDNNYYWNYKGDTSINGGLGTNTWSTSLLNTVNLNTNFLNNIDSPWRDKIVESTWKVGGNTFDNLSKNNIPTVYQNEIVNPDTTDTTDGKSSYDAKVGLMYLSDFGYAASPTVWNTYLYEYKNNGIPSINWLQIDTWEWTISRCSDYNYSAFRIYAAGYADWSNTNVYSEVRPVFYLKSDTKIIDGDGSRTDVFRIN